jgi:hypothetical protein
MRSAIELVIGRQAGSLALIVKCCAMRVPGTLNLADFLV